MTRLLLILLLLSGCARDASDVQSIEVAAGDANRIETLVAFEPPEGWTISQDARLIDERGVSAPAQVGPDGRLWFVVDSLSAGRSRSYRLSDDDPTETHAARSEAAGGDVEVFVHGNHLLTYHFEETDVPAAGVDTIYRRGGYIHPVYTPAGVLVTDDYPPNHLHHHGIWAAWTNTRYHGRTPDFWNMGDGTGTVLPVSLDSSWSGSVHAGFRARHRYVDLSAYEPVDVLYETWTGQAYGVTGHERPYRVFDLEITQVLGGDQPLHLPEYRYGGVGFRGHRQWNGPENAEFLTSEGLDRSNGHATKARWCHIGGLVDGRRVGVAILGHPDNFRAPQPMRIHPDEPFFNFAPSQDGDFAIEPGEPYVARYRYVVYDGEPNAELLDRLWNDYASPPVVTVESR